ncbi:hypothetical protein AB0M39_25185 [Streptomyces sp. NPDC051907]|uniref:WXG100-like domain-containing protein n=1 Tax=Streptomyces sp. NPDC051907 TaxID=3155284 RepID=UPI0034346C13
MGAFEEAKEWLVESMGMWWPDGDEAKLRKAATAWRNYADAVKNVRIATNTNATTLIHNNKGEAIEAFDEFWRRYSNGEKGWLQDLEGSARQMAQALEDLADDIEDVKDKIDTQLAISAGVIVAGIGLAFFTAGLAAGAAATAAATIVEFAAGMGVVISTTAARIAATALVGAVFGGVESVTVDLAVAQPLQIATGNQDGYSLELASQAATNGMIFGGAFGAGFGGAQSVVEAGGLRTLLNDVPFYLRPPAAGPGPAAVPGLSAADDPNALRLIRQDDDFGATHNPFGLRKSRYDSEVGLIPANPDGDITPLQHVRGGQVPQHKENSQFTSFAPADGTGKVYGKEELRVDYQRLQDDIAAGKVKDVDVWPAERVQQSIQDEIDLVAGKHVDVPTSLTPTSPREDITAVSDDLGLSKGKTKKVADRIMALLNTRRDGEWLISGTIPKDYIHGPYSTSGQ